MPVRSGRKARQNNGPLEQSASSPDSRSGGRGFEPRTVYAQTKVVVAQRLRASPRHGEDRGSIPRYRTTHPAPSVRRPRAGARSITPPGSGDPGSSNQVGRLPLKQVVEVRILVWEQSVTPARVIQLAERPRLERGSWGFESLSGYQTQGLSAGAQCCLANSARGVRLSVGPQCSGRLAAKALACRASEHGFESRPERLGELAEWEGCGVLSRRRELTPAGVRSPHSPRKKQTPVTQRTEGLITNQAVPGSNPGRGTAFPSHSGRKVRYHGLFDHGLGCEPFTFAKRVRVPQRLLIRCRPVGRATDC